MPLRQLGVLGMYTVETTVGVLGMYAVETTVGFLGMYAVRQLSVF